MRSCSAAACWSSASESKSGCSRAQIEALRPAREPKTSSSVSELEPSRLAPLIRNARALAGRVEAGQCRGGVDVRVDPPHHVVDHRSHRDRFVDGIDATVVGREFTHERDLRVDLLLAQVPHVEVHVAAILPRKDVALLLLLYKCLRQAVAGTEFHRTQLGMPLVADVECLAEIVVLEVALALGVEEDATLSAGGLGESGYRCRGDRSGGTGRTPCPSTALRPCRPSPCHRRS